jgi:hypothetical protein
LDVLEGEVKRKREAMNLNISEIEIETLDERGFDSIKEDPEENQDSPQKVPSVEIIEETPSLFQVESKYCTACKLEQPLRTKHCKNCNRCVATYDHHCPWIGNCVAEKNRRFFFYFLLSQLSELIWATYYLV